MKHFQTCAFFLILFETLVFSSCNTNKNSSLPNSSDTEFYATNESTEELSPVQNLSDWLKESDVTELQTLLNSGYPDLIYTEFSISSDDTLCFSCCFKEQLTEASVAELQTILSQQLSSLEPSFEKLVAQYYNETNGLLANLKIQYLNADNSLIYSQVFSYMKKNNEQI